jgi:glycosyltransferase involved in cell wall biosynthesis
MAGADARDGGLPTVGERAPAGTPSTRGGTLPLSVFIIARNEADRIGATIAAIRDLTDDLIVVDSGSDDETVAVSEKLGARVIARAWQGYGPQKRFAEEQCRHDWVLNLDADEVVPPHLADEIRSLFEGGRAVPADAYRIGIAEIFPGEDRPHPWAYTLWPIRLYRLSRGRYSPSPVHDRVELTPGTRTATLRGIVHHFSVRSLGDQIAKLNRYTDQQADDLAARGVRIPTWRVYVELPAAFLKAYFGRRHFVRGTYGFLTAVNYAISRHLRLAKHVERNQRTPE